ncbi:hypothetical protein ACFQ67_00115 [Streptomyces sp. NPDC056488]|uniref:hypothetical protein n=1 Tax=Streptomyces sp. NPDC056488 TaxID=3345836 RepID=UPI0036C46A88
MSQSWDDFKTETWGNRTEVIENVTVRVPTDVPFGFEERLSELSASSAREDVEELVESLFGPDVLDQWIDAGMGVMGLMTVLTWGMAQAGGQTGFTFKDAWNALNSDDPGKALEPQPRNRAERRERSRSTGGRSKRTSSGSTDSTRAA